MKGRGFKLVILFRHNINSHQQKHSIFKIKGENKICDS